MRIAFLSLLVACGSRTPPTTATTADTTEPITAGAPVVLVCPRTADLAEPWWHEIFPGCAPFPLALGFDVCTPAGECPRPCMVLQRWGDAQAARVEVVREDRGQWTELRGGQLLYTVFQRCSYEDGLLAACKARDTMYRIERDAARRIRKISDTDTVIAIRYAPSGLPIAIDRNGRGSRFEYDAQGRLITEHAMPAVRGSTGGTEPIRISYHYDRAGHLVRSETSQGQSESFTYDARQRVTETDGVWHGQRVELQVVDYDDAGRPVRVTDTYRGQMVNRVSYDYCDR